MTHYQEDKASGERRVRRDGGLALCHSASCAHKEENVLGLGVVWERTPARTGSSWAPETLGLPPIPFAPTRQVGHIVEMKRARSIIHIAIRQACVPVIVCSVLEQFTSELLCQIKKNNNVKSKCRRLDIQAILSLRKLMYFLDIRGVSLEKTQVFSTCPQDFLHSASFWRS